MGNFYCSLRNCLKLESFLDWKKKRDILRSLKLINITTRSIVLLYGFLIKLLSTKKGVGQTGMFLEQILYEQMSCRICEPYLIMEFMYTS